MTSNGSWQKVRFDEICKNISDRIDDPKQAKTDYYVGLEHLDSEDPKISRHGNPQDVGATKLKFKTGHILFGKRRWYLRKLAVAEREGICSAHMMVLESINDKIKKEFLPILMQGDDFFEKALSVSAGSLSPTIKWKDIATLEFFIPSIPDQEKILLTIHKIDRAISNSQKLVEKTKNYMISRRELLLTRGIGHTKFKKVKWFYGKTIEIPQDWDLKKLSDIILISKIPGILKNHPYIEIGDVDINTKKYSIKDKLSMSGCLLAKKDQIIVSKVRPTRGAITKIRNEFTYVSAAFAVISSKDFQIISNDYLFFCLMREKFFNFLGSVEQGGAYPSCKENDILNYLIQMPPIQEQEKILKILQNLYEQTTQQQSHLTNLKVLRKSILNSKLTKEKTNVTN